MYWVYVLKSTVAEALAVAALDITPEVVTTVMNPVAVDGDEPPAIVAAAMLAADVALLPVSYSISHSTATRKALADFVAIVHRMQALAAPAGGASV